MFGKIILIKFNKSVTTLEFNLMYSRVVECEEIYLVLLKYLQNHALVSTKNKNSLYYKKCIKLYGNNISIEF